MENYNTISVQTIAITNQKGGVGKTTTVANLGAALAERGKNICLIDLDPQAHLTMHFGIDPASVEISIYDVLTAEAYLHEAAVAISPKLTIIPAVIDLAGAEVELANEVGREQILRNHLRTEPLPYDLIMIDCPPSLGLLTLNALSAVDEVIIPIQAHFLALQGLGRLLETVSLIQQRINPRLQVSGVIFCMFDSATRLADEVLKDVSDFFQSARYQNKPWSSAHIFQTRIRRNIKLAECPGYGTTIEKYDPSSHGAQDYAALADEFLSVLDKTSTETSSIEPPPSEHPIVKANSFEMMTKSPSSSTGEP